MAKSGNQKPLNIGLNTFGGVFTPSILTILGVIMYLRFGWVVGNVGLINTLIIVTLSTLITFLTSLSIASVATNQQIREGGAYYMISRSLGIETGGAVGIPLYIAQTLSISLYTLGFAESLVAVFPVMNELAVGLITTILIGGIALLSAKLAIRVQFFILAAIAISLISLFLGQPIDQEVPMELSNGSEDSPGFWKVFAVFFPAVTGIMTGVNMSGDLKDPRKSIPKGTFLAVGAGYLIYMVLPVVLAFRVGIPNLIEDPLIMRQISFWGDAILLGVWGATLSSALGSMMGAPRVLQALAKDKVLPNYLFIVGKGEGPENTPRIGTILTLVIASLAVYFGNLNLIAPILTMFFLTTYGVLNIASAIENLLGNPSFRPQFKVSWIFSTIGAVGCVSVMILINPAATIVAALAIVGIFIWMERRQLNKGWADARRGLWMGLTRAGLMKIGEVEDPKNWFPHLLILSGAPTKRWHLIALSNSLIHVKGLMTVATVVPSGSINLSRQKTLENNIREFLLDKGMKSFVRVVSAPDPFEGGLRLAEAYGIGNLYPNTFVVGETTEPDHFQGYCDMMQRIYEAKKNILLIRENSEKLFGRFQQVDIWSSGLKDNGSLMILLGHMLRKSLAWRNAQVTLKFVSNDSSALEETRKSFDNLISDIRVDFKQEIIPSEGKPFFEILKKHSTNTDLIFLGMKKPDKNFSGYIKDTMEKTEGLPTTMFVLAGQEVDFREALK